MVEKKLLFIDRATEETTELILPRPPLFSSVKAGWDNVFLEYHCQPSGEHEEVCASGHSIAIFTKVGDCNRAERTVDGQFYQHSVEAGDILIIPANAGVKANWEGDSEFILIGLHPQVFSYILNGSTSLEKVEITPQITIADPLILQIGLALNLLLQNNIYNRLYVETIANALFVHLIQYYSSTKSIAKEYRDGLGKSQLRQVTDYIIANLDRDLYLQELADIVRVSPRYFASLFKRSTGLTPHQYVISLRIDRAKQLLLQGTISIADIAQTVGFANQSHLNLHFKRLVGVTPKYFSSNSDSAFS
jgi:AraC family transcriptional regulator